MVNREVNGAITDRSNPERPDSPFRDSAAGVPTGASVSGPGKPAGACPGYVVDHVVALACGADEPANMQWQTVAEGKAKDRWERVGCKS